METIDYEALAEAVAAKVWENMNIAAGNLTVEPLSEQSDMVQMNLKAQVIPFIHTTAPIVKAHTERAYKEKLIGIINESHENGFDDTFTLLALTSELSESED